LGGLKTNVYKDWLKIVTMKKGIFISLFNKFSKKPVYQCLTFNKNGASIIRDIGLVK
jgi:hypothetical protein